MLAMLLIEIIWVSVAFGEGHSVAAFLVLSMFAITLSAVVRAVEAVFSKRIRTSIREHPVAHLIWFGLAVVGLLLLVPAFAPAKTKGEVGWCPPNKSPEPTAVGAVSSAVAVHVASRRWLSFFR